MKNQTQVIVIGAGIAGLSAAQSLQNEGWEVTVLEGRARIGGRIWTQRAWPQAPLEMGARWIQGVKKNPITKLAKQIKATRLRTDYDNAWLYANDGQLLGDSDWEHLETLGEKLIRRAVRTQRKSSTADCDLHTALNRLESVRRLSDGDRRRLDFYVNTVIEHELAADISELSTLHMDDGKEFKGGDVILPEGYDHIISHLAQGLDIHLNQPVEAIAYRPRITVRTIQGSFQAEKALVTLPLGVLKRETVHFSPPLPQSKQAAIDQLGVGILNPTYLRFPYAFWPQEPELLNVLSAQKGVWSEWYNLYHHTGQPILLGYNAGAYGRHLEARPDRAVVEEAMAVLRRLYGSGIPAPEAWQIGRWGQDPFAGGSYSFNGVGTSRKTRQQLAQPVAGRLFFAGEATSRDFPATVHGAYLSGQREARRIMAG